jgi:hypothetical protein
MKPPRFVLAALLVTMPALAAGASSSGTPEVATVNGTILCRDAQNPHRYSSSCGASARFALVTQERAYDIAHQDFSGLRALVGVRVRVIGELTDHRIDILQIEEEDACPTTSSS